MSNTSTESSVVVSTEQTRPFGVWFLTIWDAIFFGVVPLVVMVALMGNREAQQELSLTVTSFIWPTLVALGVVMGAVLAWRGDKMGRNLLLAAIVVHHGGIAFQNVTFALSFAPGELDVTGFWANAVRSVLWIAIHLWYFLGRRTKHFYGA